MHKERMLCWLLAQAPTLDGECNCPLLQGDDVFPIPGTRNPKHVEENVAALAFSRTLTAEEIAELEAAVPAAQVSNAELGSGRVRGSGLNLDCCILLPRLVVACT
jgi:hypothetical protein